jgi:hypothetical protein
MCSYVFLFSSGQPSRQPSSRPSFQPSTQPSVQPTTQPTGQPSSQPSGYPSCQPSSQPTSQPTFQPSSYPTGQPTNQPTSHPSGQPSRQPSSQPSAQPSRRPTGQPSRQPSTQPTIQPTNQPSSKPSRQPTGQPSLQPSSQPSSSPSMQPTRQPTNQPSIQPTSQPSSQPSGKPTTQPTLIPTSFPSRVPSLQPSSQPSAQPSSQPSNRPSSQPTSLPSTIPTGQPTLNPTSQPTVQPSSQPSETPSSQPTTQPSNQPTSCPTVQPSNQPTEQPTLQPTSHPTIFKQHCENTTFYSFLNNACLPCPLHSVANGTGQTTCQCFSGYSTHGYGKSLRCLPCRPGEFSFFNSVNCTLCPAGYFSAGFANPDCHRCPPGTYNVHPGQSTFQVCPSGTSTNSEAATSEEQCLSPLPHLYMGLFSFFFVVALLCWYLIFGKFYRLSYERRKTYVLPLMKTCRDLITFFQQKRMMDQAAKRQSTLQSYGEDHKKQPNRFIFIFLCLLSSVSVPCIVFYSYLKILYKSFFMSLIIYRGIHIAFPSLNFILSQLTNVTHDLSLLTYSPVLYYAMLPFLSFFTALANIRVNLASKTVPCGSSESSIELLIAVVVVGLLILFIKTDYFLLLNIVVKYSNQHYLGHLYRTGKTFLFGSKSFYLSALLAFITTMNPLLLLLRYCMGFISFKAFSPIQHAISNGSEVCNHIPNVPYFGSFLGYLSAAFVWWIALPTLYTLSEVVVIKTAFNHQKYAKQTIKISNDLSLTSKVSEEKKDKEEADAQHFIIEFLSLEEYRLPDKICPEKDQKSLIERFVAFYQQEKSNDNHDNRNSKDQEEDIEKSPVHEIRNHEMVISVKSKRQRIEDSLTNCWKSKLRPMLNYYKDQINSFFAFDLYLMFLISSWIKGLEREKNKEIELDEMKNVQKQKKEEEFKCLTFDNESRKLPLVAVQAIKATSTKEDSRNNDNKNNNNNIDQKVLFYFTDQEIKQQQRRQSLEKEMQQQPTLLLQKRDRGFFTLYLEYEEQRRIEQEEADELWKEYSHQQKQQNKKKTKRRNSIADDPLLFEERLPSFYKLCLKVKKELREVIAEPFATILAFLTIGHFLTPVGRYYWKYVFQNYKIFFLACFGVWSDLTVESYDLILQTTDYCAKE